VLNDEDYPGIDWHHLGFELSNKSTAEILFVGVDVVDDEFLAEFPSLKLIASRTTNRDNIISHKIPVVYLSHLDVADITSAAEFTVLLMLALVKKIKTFGEINSRPFGDDLSGKTLSIFGYGRIGKKVASIASAIGMSVLKCSRHTSIEECYSIIKASDIVSLHLPAGAQFVDFLDENKISKMREDAFIVNTARPYMISKNALLDALQNRMIAGAALDYLSCDNSEIDEELVNYAKNADNLIITPHLGGSTAQAMQRSSKRLVKKVRDLCEKQLSYQE